jgi:hypothetical protein
MCRVRYRCANPHGSLHNQGEDTCTASPFLARVSQIRSVLFCAPHSSSCSHQCTFRRVAHITGGVGVAQSIQGRLEPARLGFNSQQGLGSFLHDTASRTALGPIQPPIQWVPKALSPGVKRPGREADHSAPSSAEVKKAWSYTSTPQYVFMAWCLIK